MEFFLHYLRELGAEISEFTGQENRVEDDIRKALGKYYELFPAKTMLVSV
ncbi:MAG: hypothetical protein AAB655_02760 [Patescibacteria group bacterium]